MFAGAMRRRGKNLVVNALGVRALVAALVGHAGKKNGPNFQTFSRIGHPIEATILGGATDGSTSAATVARLDVPPKDCREHHSSHKTAGRAARSFGRFCLPLLL
jgi:hypothetical protein